MREVELGIDPDELTNPWHAAGASFLAFTVGALLPLLAIVLPPASLRLVVTVLAVLAALALTGWSSARLGTRRWAARCCGTWAGERWRWGSPTRRGRCWGRSGSDPAAALAEVTKSS